MNILKSIDMLEKKKLLETTEYWFDELQNELFRQVSNYMETNKLNRVKLAEELGVSKGYVSQVLNGNCNFSLKKIVELSLAIGKAPIINYVPLSNSADIERLSNYFSDNIENPMLINASGKSREFIITESHSFVYGKIDFAPVQRVIIKDSDTSHALAA